MATAERIQPVVIEEEVQSSFIDYAMSVIVSRALPDVRDGLKPVHRRILYSMLETGLQPNRPRRKSAAAVGDVVKKYHPHGTDPVYDALVRMAQDFSLRYPLVDPQGNFGSIDGDPPAAMRYCLTGDARIRTARGTKRLDAFVADAAPNSDNPIDEKVVDHRGDLVRAEMLFHSGTHPTRRLTTREGYSLTGTLNHPVLTLVSALDIPVFGWKLLEDVRPGDRVVLLRKPPDEIGVLSNLEEHLAVLAGAMVAEGWASQARAGFNNVDVEYFDRVVAAYDAVIGGPRYVSKRKIRSGSVLFELDIQDLTALRESPLSELIGSRSHAKRIPSFVWAGSPAFKALFLRSLFEGDGSSSLLSRRTIQISYSTRSETLAREVQQLLLEFGVVSRLSPYSSGEWKVVVTNRRDARLFATAVGFLGRKQRKFEGELDDVPSHSPALSSDHIPFLAGFLRAEGAAKWVDRDWLSRHNVDRIERWDREANQILSHTTNPEVRALIAPLVDGRYYFAEVTSVEDAGEQAVYSIRVDSTDHSFVSNGFVSHNTECRLAPLAMEMLRDIDKETVDFVPNFDGYEQEPVVLPAGFPNLLVNGSSGIAVGMATNVPPHNLGEVVDGVVALIDHPEVSLRDLMKNIKGPDFPTGGMIMGRDGIKDAYTTGRGSIRMRARVMVEEGRQGRQRLVVSELPYMVNKARLAEKIAQLHRAGKIRDVADLKDESSRVGMRLVIDLRRGANPQVVLNQLYKHTQLQDSFGVNMLALVDGVPRTLDLKQVLQHYLDHQVEVITRRTRFELREAEQRDHLVQGLLIALANIDEVIRIIRAANDTEDARTKLMRTFKLSELQANHILDMPLRRLTRLERQKLEEEHKELLATIKRLKALLKNPKAILGVVKDELLAVRKRYADTRRTEIKADGGGELDIEDLIQEQDVIITVSRAGYVKRLPLETYRRQGRGGRGVIGANLKIDDIIAQVFTTTTHHWLLVFTNKGKVYRTKVHEVPEGSRVGRGTYVANLPGMGFGGDERIAAVIDVKDYNAGRFLVFATKKGQVKKTSLAEYDSPRTGLAAINLRDGDELISAILTEGKDDLLLVSRQGQAIRFSEAGVRPMGRQAAGVIGMKLRQGDEVIAMVSTDQGDGLLTVTNNGFGKRTDFSEYPRKGRGGYGVKTALLTSKVGVLAGAFPISKDQDILVIANDGVVIRVPASQVRKAGRATQGVRVMRLGKGRSVVAVAPVIAQAEE